MADPQLFAVSPDELTLARLLCHEASQWPSKAARANLTALADDSHSALQWSAEHSAVVSQALDPSGAAQLGFSFADRALVWITNAGVGARLELAGQSNADIGDWVDATLADAGLAAATNAAVPYVLEPVDFGALDGAAQAIAVLGAWYREADAALESVVARFNDVAVNDVAVRCWPHHFDIATLFALEAGDPETARSIGVGLSPGDGIYAQPYLYCTPWPVPTELGAAPGKTTWHTEGFTSLVCPADRVGPADDIAAIFEESIAYLLGG